MTSIRVVVATKKHLIYADSVCQLIEISAKERGTGIAKREPEYIKMKIDEGKAIIALEGEQLAGFCYIETWSDKSYVVNSGLIVAHAFRKSGLAKKIKRTAFEHSKKMFPNAKMFGLTTSLAVMKINSELGYHPVTYDRLTTDQVFWRGCSSCVNYEILKSKEQSNCICTAMLYDPKEKKNKKWDFIKKSSIYQRFMQIKKKQVNQIAENNE
ncbi:MAG: hypothetical protein ACI8QD_000350 [Cyclobacteriaceae bacterium]|jgi:hypothetical protein